MTDEMLSSDVSYLSATQRKLFRSRGAPALDQLRATTSASMMAVPDSTAPVSLDLIWLVWALTPKRAALQV